MQELNVVEVDQVSGAISSTDAALTIMVLGCAGGPFTAGFGITIGLGILLFS